MKKKNKVLLTLMGLVVLSGIAATSSTFAWFTTIRNATVSFTDVTVESEGNDLNIELKSSLSGLTADAGSTSVEQGGTNELTLTGTTKVTDVSSDGHDFYKPVWNAMDNQIADSIEEIDLTAGNDPAEGFFVDFTLTISLAAGYQGTQGLNVYLGPGTEITPKTDAANQARNDKAVAATRMAVLDGNNTILIYSPVKEASGYKYITYTGVDTDKAHEVEEYKVETLSDVREEATYFEYFSTVDDVTQGYEVIADLQPTAGNDSKDITFRVWIEGEDDDAVRAAIGGVFDIDIYLYGLVN